MANNSSGLLKTANELVVFTLELLMLVVFGWYAYNAPSNIGLRIGLAAVVFIAITAILTQIIGYFTERP